MSKHLHTPEVRKKFEASYGLYWASMTPEERREMMKRLNTREIRDKAEEERIRAELVKMVEEL